MLIIVSLHHHPSFNHRTIFGQLLKGPSVYTAKHRASANALMGKSRIGRILALAVP